MAPVAGHLLVVRRVWRRGGVARASVAAAPKTSPRPRPETRSAGLGARPWAGNHVIDLRASIPLPGGRWYVTILAGRERRSADRLTLEGQTHWLRRAAVYMLIMSALLWIAVCAIVVGYLIKSALGLDFFDDASPLHFIFERLFESRIAPLPHP